MSNTYSHSARLGARLSTTTAARRERVRRALARIGVPFSARDAEIPIEETTQASASVATLSPGVRVLVSYETAVAFEDGCGRFVATPYGQFSRTTDKSVANFCPVQVERVELEEFATLLRQAVE